MNIRDLEYFVALAKFKHFNKAAEHCHVSQPTLSMQIKKLENYLGMDCFERGQRTVFLTDFGKQILPVVEHILEQVKNIKVIAQDFKDPFESNFVFGSIHTVAPYLLPDVVKSLHKKYPKMTLQLLENKTLNLIDQLKKGEVELIILASEEQGMEKVTLFQDELFVMVPKEHALSRKASVSREDLEYQQMILLERGHCLCETILSRWGDFKFEINDFRATSLETLRAMVMGGQGLSIMPKIAVREDPQLCYIPFEQPFYRTLYAYYRPETPREKTLIKICEEIKACYQDQA